MSDVKKILEGWQKQGIAFVRFELPDMHGISRSKTIPIRHAGDYAERGSEHVRGDQRAGHAIRRGRAAPSTTRNAGTPINTSSRIPTAPPSSRGPTRRLGSSATRSGTTALRSARRPGTCSAVCWISCRGDGLRAVDGFGVRVLSPDRRHARAALLRLSHLQHPAERLRADDPNDPRADAHRSVSTSSRRTASTPARSGRSTSHRVGVLPAPTSAFTFKNGVKEIARNDGYLATFMSKPLADSAGSGCHTHMSLVGRGERRQRVRRRRRPEGHERHVPIASSRACSGTRRPIDPADLSDHRTVFRRTRRHTFSPTNISWGIEDRSALLRVKNGCPVRARRVPGADAPFEPLPGRRRAALGRPAWDRGRASAARAVEARPSRRGRRFVRAASASPWRSRWTRWRASPLTREFFGAEFLDGVHDHAALRAGAVQRLGDRLGAAGVPRALLGCLPVDPERVACGNESGDPIALGDRALSALDPVVQRARERSLEQRRAQEVELGRAERIRRVEVLRERRQLHDLGENPAQLAPV